MVPVGMCSGTSIQWPNGVTYEWNGHVKRVHSVESFGYLRGEVNGAKSSISGKLMKGSREWDVEMEETWRPL